MVEARSKALVVGVGGLSNALLSRKPLAGLDAYRLDRDSNGYAPILVNRESGAIEELELARFKLIFNGLAVPEHSGPALIRLQEVLKDYKGVIINSPEQIRLSTRDKVAKKLSFVRGLRVPKTISLELTLGDCPAELVEMAAFHFPAILRRQGSHLGKTMRLIESKDDLAAAMEKGVKYYLTEFINFQSCDGYFRKFRVFSIGSKFILRHVLCSDNWNVHAETRNRIMKSNRKFVKEEQEWILNQEDSILSRFNKIFSRITNLVGLDVFGIDFAILDNDIILFEANASMRFFDDSLTNPEFAYLRKSLERAESSYQKLISKSIV